MGGVFFFGRNMDPSGLKELEPSAALERCFARHTKDYTQLSATPDKFKAMCPPQVTESLIQETHEIL